jgi:hypothetical protein
MREKNRHFKFSALIFAVVALAWLRAAAASPDSPEITLTWSDDPMTTQTISWKGNTSVATASVEYQVAGTPDKMEASAVLPVALPQVSSGDADARNFFSVKLSGLKPGTQYAYTVQLAGTAYGPYRFWTEASPAGEFKFLVFGDSQSGNPLKLEYQPWQETLHRSFQENPGAKFFVNVGDLVETGQSYAHWRAWFAAAQGVIETLPAMPVLGNHETYGTSLLHKDPKPVYFLSQFALPSNGPENFTGQAYAYDYGCVHFVVLDSQEDEEAGKYGDILERQSKWLERDLAATRQAWKIVFFHKPPYNNKQGRPNPAVKAAFCPVFDKYHVDVVFNGHEHGLYRTYPIKDDKIQKETWDGTVYYTTGRSGAKYYNDQGKTDWDAFAYNPQDQPCYETVLVNPAKLVITAKKQDGTVIDEYTISRQVP